MMKKSYWKPQKIVSGLLGPVVLLAVFPAPANAYPRPGRTERVSVASDGTEATGFYGYSYATSISADGRYVAFESLAENLVPGGKTNDPMFSDVYVHDRETRTTERVSVASDGTEGNGGSRDPAITSNGRYIAFVSSASNLVPGDTNGRADAFVHDRETNTTERVSVAYDGTEGNSNSYSPSISADGRYVAFMSLASNLVPGDTNGTDDVFVYDRLAHTTERVSVASDGTQGNSVSRWPSISADGRHVAFSSSASNLVPGDTNNAWDIFVHDRETGTTERVSVGSDGAEGNLDSLLPSLSADGRYVGFESAAWNLVPGDTEGRTDVFVHDRETRTTERVSVGSDGAEANSGSYRASISADGRHVAFMSFASNLLPGNTTLHVYVYDRETRAIDRVSVPSDGAGGGGDLPFSSEPSISADGRYVGFESVASNLVPGDTNGKGDVFVRDRGGPVGVGEVSVVPQGDRISVSGWATFSGQVVASVLDPPDDGATGAGPAGGELIGATLSYRPEEEDLLVRLRLASLPRLAAEACAVPLSCVGVTAGAGVPGILYGLELHLAGVRYEVRAAPRGATAESLTTAAPHFALYRCDPGCTEQTRLTGGIGTTGPEVMVSVPLAALGASEEATVERIRAFTAIGEAGSGTQETLDEADLPDAVIPAAQLWVGIAPDSTPEDQVAFTVEADLLAGDFSGTVPTAGLSPGSYRVWARACLGDACGPAVFGEVAL